MISNNEIAEHTGLTRLHTGVHVGNMTLNPCSVITRPYSTVSYHNLLSCFYFTMT